MNADPGVGNAAHFALTFSKKDLRRSGGWTLRQVLYLIGVLTALFTIGALPESVRFAYFAEPDASQYNLHLNGPMTSTFVARLAENPDVRSASFSRSIIPKSISHKGRTAPVRNAWVFGSASEASRLWNLPPLLLSGGDLDSEGVGLDWSIARKLDASVGNRIRLLWRFPTRELKVTRTVQAIYAPSGKLRGSLILVSRGSLEDAIQEYFRQQPLPESQLISFSNAFLSVAEPGRARSMIEAAGGDPRELQALTKEQRQAAARRQAERILPRMWQNILFWSLTVAAILVLRREQTARLKRREPDMAVLVAVGAPIRWLQLVHLFETLAATCVAAVLAVVAARWTVMNLMGVYLPSAAAVRLVVTAVIVTLLLGAWGGASIRRRIRAIPVSRLLAAEATRA